MKLWLSARGLIATLGGSSLGCFEIADYLVAIENLLRQVERPVIIMIGGLVADGGILPRDCIEPLGEFDFSPGNLLHPGSNGGRVLQLGTELFPEPIKLNLIGHGSEVNPASLSDAIILPRLMLLMGRDPGQSRTKVFQACFPHAGHFFELALRDFRGVGAHPGLEVVV